MQNSSSEEEAIIASGSLDAEKEPSVGLPQGLNPPSSNSQSMHGMGRKDASLQDLERLAQRDNDNFVMLGEGKDYAASAENLGVIHDAPTLGGGTNSNSLNYLK